LFSVNHCSLNKTVINILTINVCGLKRRIQYPEFLELVNDYDILCFVETKTDDVDEIDLPGFIIKMKNRFQFRRVKSGGIIVGFRKSLGDNISIIETDSKYVLWFKISKNIFRLQQDVLFGIVYIPPEHSLYCVGDPFSEIENEFLNFSTNYDYICLLGDFNARTAEEPDFVETNYDEFSGMLDIDNEGIDMLNELNIDIQRKSMDHRKNNFGNLLLEFCKYNNMFICNGRMCNDKGVGKFTSKDASVVDYVIGSISFLKLVQHFSVLDSSKLFSDIHTPLSLKVKCAEKPNDVTQKDETPGAEKIKQWDNEKLNSFVENIDQVQVDDILSQLTDMGENTINNATVMTVDAVVEKVCNLLTNSAKSTFGTYTKAKNIRNVTSKSKPWFDEECRQARKQFRCSKRKLKRNRTQALENDTKSLEKKYKRIMDKSIRKHRKKNQK